MQKKNKPYDEVLGAAQFAMHIVCIVHTFTVCTAESEPLQLCTAEGTVMYSRVYSNVQQSEQ